MVARCFTPLRGLASIPDSHLTSEKQCLVFIRSLFIRSGISLLIHSEPALNCRPRDLYVRLSVKLYVDICHLHMHQVQTSPGITVGRCTS